MCVKKRMEYIYIYISTLADIEYRMGREPWRVGRLTTDLDDTLRSYDRLIAEFRRDLSTFNS